MDIFPLLVLLLSCRIEAYITNLHLDSSKTQIWEAVEGKMTLSPAALTVLRGDEARFTCSTSYTHWTVMVWLLDGLVVLTISKEGGVLPSLNPNVTAEKSLTSKEDGWVFVLRSTERHNQGEVTCDLQGIDRKTARLLVQEKGSVKVSQDHKIAFKGQSVLFECEAAGWYPQPLLQWHVNDREVSQGEYNISSEESAKSLFTVTSNLNMTAAKSSQVDCLASVSALATPLKSGIHLTVVAEVVQDGDDCTVPLAVTACLAALLLLILLCVCTVLCYRQRRQAKASPPATWFNQSVSGTSSVAEATGGEVNLGYSNEGCTDAAYSEVITGTRSQMDFVSFLKVPDVVSSSSLSLHRESQGQVHLEEESSNNIRRITTV